MILGMLFSGILGYEREQKGRPAGFRTYIVVCMGAEIAMMTGIYLKIYMGDKDERRMVCCCKRVEEFLQEETADEAYCRAI